MKAVVYDRYGGPEVLELRDVPGPVAGRGEVVVRVAAAAVNPLDWKIRSGSMKLLAGSRFPKFTGFDLSGTVESCGPGVVGLRPGDPVLGGTNPFKRHHGTFAERCVTRAEWVMRKPERLSHAEAAAVAGSGVSALVSLRHCRVRTGSRIMLIGASGGLGTFAIQIAKAHGAHVTAVCRPHALEACGRLGADVVIDRSREDPLAAHDVYDAVLDLAAAYKFARCRHLLARDGIYLHTMPGAGTLWSQIWTRLFSAKRARVLMMKPVAGDLKELGTLIASGAVTPVVSRTFPFTAEAAREMHGVMEAGRVLGKLVMVMPTA